MSGVVSAVKVDNEEVLANGAEEPVQDSRERAGREDDELFGEAADGDADGQPDEGGDAEVEEDCEPKKIAPDPGMPTQAEVDEHDVDHYPYRSWCEDCV